MRNERPAKHQEHKSCEAKAPVFPPPVLVGSQESVLKVPKQGQFHAAIRVTPKLCDSCAQGEILRRTVSRRIFLRCGIASEVLRRNMPLSRSELDEFKFVFVYLAFRHVLCKPLKTIPSLPEGGSLKLSHHPHSLPPSTLIDTNRRL